MTDFTSLGLAPALVKTLQHSGFTEPTPIQSQAIPLALEGHDIMGLAQTGTGKTLAFGLPLMDKLLRIHGKPESKSVRALVLAPTRELVNQIAESLRAYTKSTPIKINTVVGGQSIGRQIGMLNRGSDIVVATPGRLIDLMERNAVRLDTVRFLVLDEADQMLDLGFIHALRKIAAKLGQPRQTMLFSATMPKQMEEISRAYLKDPKRVQVSVSGKAADKVTQSVHFLDKRQKPATLRQILSANPDASSIVFARTKHGAEKLMKQLVADGYNAASIHGNKSQGQRDRAIRAFRGGETNVLVATDVAARGIDIPGVTYVINYELPDTPENYVHRIGRTARAGREGEAIALCSSDEIGQLRQIEKVMKASIPLAEGSAPEPAPTSTGKPAGRGGPKKGGKPRHRGDRQQPRSEQQRPPNRKPRRTRRSRAA
ncbi:DEAD/DEAH box helicase [Notoacmeibacter marinus]|uniref:DEAD/DEAH box helicase n=1 Tax=Notoacmeibacter marinus TaxID=1876515 RepID=A0A231V1M5_9HYPH|nr:DEAD/DEAH box helicase [Notoacmeibacter marinus]OXT02014.1 DEAD/DEAH box helicase [Notoacmeibacter marinus]